MVAKSNDARAAERYRILHIFRAPVGGLFRHVMDLARIQAEAGHAVGIICDSVTGGERGERALADLLPYLELGLVRIPMRRNRIGRTGVACGRSGGGRPWSAPMSCTATAQRAAPTPGWPGQRGDPLLHATWGQLQLPARHGAAPPLHGRRGGPRPPDRRLPVRERVRRRSASELRGWTGTGDPHRPQWPCRCRVRPPGARRRSLRPPLCRRVAGGQGPALPARSPGPAPGGRRALRC